MTKNKEIIQTENLNLWYGEKQALINVTMNVEENKVTSLIGPSGCGKSTLIRCFNRMNDVIDICRIEGKIFYQGKNIYDKSMDDLEKQEVFMR